MDISILEIRNAKSLMIDREWLAGIMPTAERIISGELHTEKDGKALAGSRHNGRERQPVPDERA